jgi:hypothetical protein
MQQEDWIELQTRKYGTVLFNKQTGEVTASQSTAAGHGEEVPTSATVSAAPRSKKTKTRKKTKHDGTVTHRRDHQEPEEASGAEGEGSVETPQPALRKRRVHY